MLWWFKNNKRAAYQSAYMSFWDSCCGRKCYWPVLRSECAQGCKSFFSEIISSISDVQFTSDGKYMLSRDYMTLKLWDLSMESAPVATYPVIDGLRNKVWWNAWSGSSSGGLHSTMLIQWVWQMFVWTKRLLHWLSAYEPIWWWAALMHVLWCSSAICTKMIAFLTGLIARWARPMSTLLVGHMETAYESFPLRLEPALYWKPVEIRWTSDSRQWRFGLTTSKGTP
jgi:hypothetical protein